MQMALSILTRICWAIGGIALFVEIAQATVCHSRLVRKSSCKVLRNPLVYFGKDLLSVPLEEGRLRVSVLPIA